MSISSKSRKRSSESLRIELSQVRFIRQNENAHHPHSMLASTDVLKTKLNKIKQTVSFINQSRNEMIYQDPFKCRVYFSNSYFLWLITSE